MTSAPRPSPPRTEERESRVRTVSGGIGGIRPKIEHRRRTGNKDEDDCGDGWGRPSLGRRRWRGRVLLDKLVALLARFVVLPKWGAETLALWILHTYVFELRDVSTYLNSNTYVCSIHNAS